MPTVIPVRMHFSIQDLWFNPKATGAAKGDHVVVSTERGVEFGIATRDPFEAPADEVKGELKPVLRIATDDDIAKAESLAVKGEEAMPVFRQLVKDSGLDMKPVGVEFLFGGEKIVFYFAAEDRVDFRDLVRDLAAHFHQRVDMRQIGVRDEARLIGGYAPCGQELCCVRFGGEFEPVSIRMAKEQDLPLNSAKISGVCGRLMCCLRYEFEAYRDFKQRAPKKNAVIDTPLGKAKIVEYNTPRETLTLRLENGKSFAVALKDMTCSDGCCKRSAEQHIPLRPDTVTREALERVGTADMALQLAELDRANDPQGGYELDDSLLDGRRARKRSAQTRSKDAGEAAGDARRTHDGQKPSEPGAPARQTKRRAADRDESASGGQRTPRGRAARADATAETPETQERRQPRGGGMRPRRSNKAGGAERKAEEPRRSPSPETGRRGRRGDAAAETSTPQQPARHTRRHHCANGTGPGVSDERASRDRQQPAAPKAPRETGEMSKTADNAAAPVRRRRTHQGKDAGAGRAEHPGKVSKPQQRDAGASEARQPPRRRRPGDKGGGMGRPPQA